MGNVFIERLWSYRNTPVLEEHRQIEELAGNRFGTNSRFAKASIRR
jgi:hypothetical protein